MLEVLGTLDREVFNPRVECLDILCRVRDFSMLACIASNIDNMIVVWNEPKIS